MSENSENPVEPVQSITIGAIGQPGARVFYLQLVSAQGDLSALALEKTQAFILADQIDSLLDTIQHDYPVLLPAPVITALPLVPPDYVLFRAGKFGLQYNPEADVVALHITELLGVDQGTAASLEIRLTRQQLRALSNTALQVARQGIASID